MRRRSLLGAAASGGLAGLAGCLFASPDTAAVPDADGGDGDGDGDGDDGGSTPTTETTAATSDGDDGTTTATTETTADGSDGTTTSDDGTTTAETTPTATTTESGPQESVTVVVGEGGTQYAPDEFRLAVGGTVEWVWEGNGHNVIPTEQPDDADWEGTDGPNSKTYDVPHEYSDSFDVPGEYAYRCFIHGNYGMVGSFTVE